MRGAIFLSILIISSYSVFAETVINEIMYNPEGNDNNKEFIEIYSDDYVNLSGFIIADADSNDTLTEVKYFDFSYSLIVEEGFNYSNINASVYSVGATIGNNLGNEGDNITLFYPNGSSIDSVNYLSSWGADGDGYSLEKLNPNGTDEEDNWEVSLVLSGTPGAINSRTLLADVEADYSLIAINEFLADPEGDDNNAMPEGEWIELFNSNHIDVDLTWFYFKNLNNRQLFITTTNTYSTIIPADGFLTLYTNGFGGFLTNEQNEIKFYDRDDNLLETISYGDTYEGTSWSKIGGVWQKTMPTDGAENIEAENINESYIIIENFYDLGTDGKAKFGQMIRVNAIIYKGYTTKNNVKLWVEDKSGTKVSKVSSVNLYSKYKEYSLALPVQLMPNCDYDYSDGEYKVVVGGFDKSVSQEFEIEGITESLCEEVKVYKLPSSTSGKLEYKIFDMPGEIAVEERFTSEVKLTNYDDNDLELDVWSYVYRGSKCYSGERESNLRHITVPKQDSVVVELSNKVYDAEPGDYKFKVNIQKEGQKTTKSIIQDIQIAEGEESTIESVDLKSKVLETDSESIEAEEIYETKEFMGAPEVIYESNDFRARKLVPIFIVILTTLISVIFIFKK